MQAPNCSTSVQLELQAEWPRCTQNLACSELNTDDEISNDEPHGNVQAHQNVLTGENSEGVEKPLETKSFQCTPALGPLEIATKHCQTITTHGSHGSNWNIVPERCSAVTAGRVLRKRPHAGYRSVARSVAVRTILIATTARLPESKMQMQLENAESVNHIHIEPQSTRRSI